MRGRRLGLTALVAVVAMALVAVPASAATPTDRAQNKQIKKIDKRTKSAAKRLRTLATNLGKLTADVKKANDGLAAIQAAVPTVVSSLTTLGNAARDLKAGLETAGAGLTTLSNAFKGYVGAAEYGVAVLYVGTTPAPGQILVSSDVPDDSNQATVTGRYLVQLPDGTTDAPLRVLAGMRSGEKDGTGAANPVGQAGLMSMSVTALGTATLGGGHPGDTQTVPLTSEPNPAYAGAPVFAIPDKAPRVDAPPNPFVFPGDKLMELTDPTRLLRVTDPDNDPSRFTVSKASGLGGVIVDVTVRFHDLSASATDLDE